MMNTAAILLCAGKGTRMGQSDRSKVAYDCAGVPVIKTAFSCEPSFGSKVEY